MTSITNLLGRRLAEKRSRAAKIGRNIKAKGVF